MIYHIKAFLIGVVFITAVIGIPTLLVLFPTFLIITIFLMLCGLAYLIGLEIINEWNEKS